MQACPDHPGSWVVSKGRRQTKAGTKQRFSCTPMDAPAHSFSVLVEALPAPRRSRRGDASAQLPRCPVPGHEDSWVVSKGMRKNKAGSYLLLRCTPTTRTPHTFRVVDGKVIAPKVALWAPPPRCPDHPGAHIVRDGLYAKDKDKAKPTKKARQRYRCYPNGRSGPHHRFTPALPRAHVHVGHEECVECEEQRGMHHGDPTISRRQSWSSRLVAEALRDLSAGASYSMTGRRVRKVTKRKRSRESEGKKRKGYPGQRLSRNAWHIAADWCEIYSPVLWDYVEPQLRARTAAAVKERERLLLAKAPNPEPLALLIDDIPIHATFTDEDSRRVTRRDYFILIAAEVRWGDVIEEWGELRERELRLRLARAYPTNDHHAWKLLFDELGYTPDFVIADAGTGLIKGVEEYYKGAVTFIPSLFHVREAIEEGLYKTAGVWTRAIEGGSKELVPALHDHVLGLTRRAVVKMAPSEWTKWWDDLEGILTTLDLPVAGTRKRRKNYEGVVARILPALAAQPNLPLATGGLEVALRMKIQPVLENRSHAFANIERTNRLLDLVVCRDFGLFDDMSMVISLLRADSSGSDGWSTPLRMVSDPQPPGKKPKDKPYSSLRDQLLVREMVRQKGLA